MPLVSVVAAWFVEPPEVPVCAVEEFECADGTCIPADRQCDGFADCWDRSDEINCGWYSKLSIHALFLHECSSKALLIAFASFLPRGVATGRTGVDMSTPLLPEVVPEIDANPVSFYSG